MSRESAIGMARVFDFASLADHFHCRVLFCRAAHRLIPARADQALRAAPAHSSALAPGMARRPPAARTAPASQPAPVPHRQHERAHSRRGPAACDFRRPGACVWKLLTIRPPSAERNNWHGVESERHVAGKTWRLRLTPDRRWRARAPARPRVPIRHSIQGWN